MIFFLENGLLHKMFGLASVDNWAGEYFKIDFCSKALIKNNSFKKN
jgi:hypothetical protein